MRYFLTFLIFIVAFFGVSQETFSNGNPRFKGSKENGSITGLYDDGSKHYVGQYCNSEPCGEWKFYNEDGSLVTMRNYKNGLEQGKTLHYYKSGELEGVSKFQKGIRLSFIGYYKNGNIRIKESFFKNGEPKEDIIRFDKNGKKL